MALLFGVLQMYCYFKCFVALLHGALGWSTVCDCGISLSYSFFVDTSWIGLCLFVYNDSLRPSQQFFSYIVMDLPGLNQY